MCCEEKKARDQVRSVIHRWFWAHALDMRPCSYPDMDMQKFPKEQA